MQALAEAIAALTAPEDQRHRRGRHRAIGMADQALEDPRLAPPAARPGRGRDPLLVRAAQKQPHQAQRGRAAGQPESVSIKREIAAVVRCRGPSRQGRPNLVGDVADQAMEHRGHQRPLLLGQALRRIEEEIDADGRTAGRRPRRARARPPRPLQRQRLAIPPPSSARGYPISVNFASTREAIGAKCWSDEEAAAA